MSGGFCQYIRLSAEHIKYTTFKLPEGQDLKEALFIEPLACCIRAMDRTSYNKGDIFSVVGVGAMGMLFIQLIKLAECRAVAIDLDNTRLALAKELGADYIINLQKEDIIKAIGSITNIGIDNAILTVTNKYTLMMLYPI